MRTSPSPSGAGRLADRPATHKVLASVGVASLTALVVGGLALGDLQDLREARDAELSTALPYKNALHGIGLTAKATANDERGYLLTGDPEFLTEIEERLDKVDGYLADARSSADTADEAAFVDRLGTEIGAWSASLQAEFDVYATDRGAAVALAFDQTRGLRKTYEESLDAGLEAADAALLEGADYAETVTVAIWRTAIVCAVGVLLALGLGLAVARGLTRSLGRLRVAADRLAHGDLTVTVGLHQHDEIGRTAASLDAAVADLRAVMSTVVGAADAVAASSEELSASSAQISASAEETSAQSGVVAGAADEVSRNVQTV
ncbi:CHASE3 domain-containing protein, partial [Geodermatophilus africanus]